MFPLKTASFSRSSSTAVERQSEDTMRESENTGLVILERDREHVPLQESARRPRKRRTTMGVCWILVVLLSCASSHASLHRSPRGNEGEQIQILYLNAQSRQPVFVPCPTVTGEDVTFQLFKNQNLLCQLGTNSQNQCNQTQTSAQPCKNELNQVVGFNVTGPAARRSKAIFRCEAKIMFPPPLLLVQSDRWVLVLSDEDRCSSNKHQSTGSDSEESQRLFWIWTTAVSLLSTYSLAITTVALVIWFKLKGAENQNDYMNTKPKASRQRKKKKGVQTPIPRYF